MEFPRLGCKHEFQTALPMPIGRIFITSGMTTMSWAVERLDVRASDVAQIQCHSFDDEPSNRTSGPLEEADWRTQSS